MSAPYISTATIGSAHASDILGVSMTHRFTITCSSDGYLKLWNNNSSSERLHSEILIDKVGLHHLDVLEDVIDSKKILLIATVSFSGKIYMLQYDYELDKLINLEFDPLANGLAQKSGFWCPVFDFKAECIIFACTTVDGRARIFDLIGGEEGMEFKYRGELFANDTNFANCIASDIKNNRIAIGHQNGNTYIYDFNKLLLSYNFETHGLKNSKNLNIVRSVAFSPNDNEYLAIAHDSGPFGIISLYDVKYGEYLGSFTISTHSSNVGVGNFAHSKWCLAIDFNKTGDKLVSCGIDNCIRIWDVQSRVCLNSLKLNPTDLDDSEIEKLNNLDTSSCTSIKFIEQGIFPENGQNDGLVVVGFDRAIRLFREAGGI